MAETEREPESESSPQRKLSLFGRKREAPKLEPEPHVAVPSEPAPPEPGFSKPDFVEPQPSSELLLPAASTPQAEPEALESEGEPVPSFDEPREALDDSLETLEARGPGETPILEKTSRKFPWRSRRRQETQDLAEGEALPEPEVREVLEELEEGPGSLERELRIDVAAPLAVEEEIEPEAIVEPAEPAAADETATEEAEAPMEAEPEAEPLAEPPPAPWRRRERPSLQKAMEAAVERSFFTPLDTEGEPQGAEAADAPIRLESVAPAEEEALEAPTLDEPRPAEGAQDRGWPWRRQRKQPSLAPAPEPDEAFAPPELVEPVEPPAPAPAPAAPQPTFPNLARPAASVTGSQDLLTAPPSPTEPSIEIPAPSPDRQGEPASAPQVASARPTPLPVAQPRFVGWVERPEGGVAAAREVIVPPARAPEPEAAAPVGAGKVPCSRCGQPSERGLCEACLDAIAELRQLSAQFGM